MHSLKCWGFLNTYEVQQSVNLTCFFSGVLQPKGLLPQYGPEARKKKKLTKKPNKTNQPFTVFKLHIVYYCKICAPSKRE